MSSRNICIYHHWCRQIQWQWEGQYAAENHLIHHFSHVEYSSLAFILTARLRRVLQPYKYHMAALLDCMQEDTHFKCQLFMLFMENDIMNVSVVNSKTAFGCVFPFLFRARCLWRSWIWGQWRFSCVVCWRDRDMEMVSDGSPSILTDSCLKAFIRCTMLPVHTRIISTQNYLQYTYIIILIVVLLRTVKICFTIFLGLKYLLLFVIICSQKSVPYYRKSNISNELSVHYSDWVGRMIFMLLFLPRFKACKGSYLSYRICYPCEPVLELALY